MVKSVENLWKTPPKKRAKSPRWEISKYCYFTLSIQVCPKISLTILFLGWDVSTINPTRSGGIWILRVKSQIYTQRSDPTATCSLKLRSAGESEIKKVWWWGGLKWGAGRHKTGANKWVHSGNLT